MMKNATIPQSFVGLLYEDGVFVDTLRPGKHRFKQKLFQRLERSVTMMDMREQTLTIKGQEILTADKVAVRVSLLVYFCIEDAQAAAHKVSSFQDRIYEDVQLAARRFLASRSLDAILNDRNEISAAVLDEVSGAAAGYGVRILRAEVKDLVFPGNLREIMNQVLETERRSEAQLILARKEAEALVIKTTSEVEASRQRMAVEREQAQARAEVERRQLRLRLEAELKEAEALKEAPELLHLRELHTLAEMAHNGARFAVGLHRGQRLLDLLNED